MVSPGLPHKGSIAVPDSTLCPQPKMGFVPFFLFVCLLIGSGSFSYRSNVLLDSVMTFSLSI